MAPLVQPSWVPRNHSRSFQDHQSSLRRFSLTVYLQSILHCPHNPAVHAIIISPSSSCIGEILHTYIHLHPNFVLSCSQLFKVWLPWMTSFASSPPTKFPTFTGNPTANLSCSHFLSLIYASESLGIPLIWLLFEGRKRNNILFCVPASSTVRGTL